MTFPLDSAAPTVELTSELTALGQEAVPAHGLGAVTELSPLLQVAQVRDRASLQGFLEAYRATVLVPVEWTAILRAHGLESEAAGFLPLRTIRGTSGQWQWNCYPKTFRNGRLRGGY